MSQREMNALIVSESSPKKCGLSKSPSFAQCDLEAYRRAFNVSDRNKSGVIVAKDILLVAKRLGYQISVNQLADILSSNELTESSPVTFELFLDLLPRNKRQISEDEHRDAELREKFHQYDADRKGYISLADAQLAVQSELDLSPLTAHLLVNRFVRLRYDHFSDFFKQLQEKKLEIYEKFGKFDTDRDGMVSMTEAYVVLHRELGFSQENSNAMVQRFDHDKDGHLSYAEFGDFYVAFEESKAKLKQAFQKFDEDEEGWIGNDQAEQIVQETLGFSEDRSKKTIEKYDRNKDGRIDYDEFIHLYAMIEDRREHLVQEFKRFDQDRDGHISVADFRKTLEDRGHPKGEVDRILSECNVVEPSTFLSLSSFQRFLNISDDSH